MSTPALNPLVDKIRTAHPGAYDDMDDATLTKAVLAKYPQYSDLAVPPKTSMPGAPSTQVPMQTSALGALAPQQVPQTKGAGASQEGLPGFEGMNASSDQGSANFMSGAGIATAGAMIPGVQRMAKAGMDALPWLAASAGIKYARENLPGGNYIPQAAELLPFFMAGKGKKQSEPTQKPQQTSPLPEQLKPTPQAEPTTNSPPWPPPEPQPQGSTNDMRSRSGPMYLEQRTAADRLDDRALQQEMSQGLERQGQNAGNEARKQFFAGNTTGVTKGQLTARAPKQAAPSGASEDLTPVLQQMLDQARAKKGR